MQLIPPKHCIYYLRVASSLKIQILISVTASCRPPVNPGGSFGQMPFLLPPATNIDMPITQLLESVENGKIT